MCEQVFIDQDKFLTGVVLLTLMSVFAGVLLLVIGAFLFAKIRKIWQKYSRNMLYKEANQR